MTATPTRKPSRLEPQMRIQYLPGVGPRRAEQLARLGIKTVSDLLYLFPRRYIDVAAVVRIGSLQTFEGEVTVTGTVAAARRLRGRGGRNAGFEAVLDDGSGQISCTFFGRGFMSGVMERGQRWIVFGRLKLWRDRLFLAPLEYERLDCDEKEDGLQGKIGGVIPVYPATEGLGQKLLRRLTAAALPAAASFTDRVPEKIRLSLALPSRSEAFRLVHRPAKVEQAAGGRRALAFEELFYLELMLLGRKFHIGAEQRIRKYVPHNHLLKKLAVALPFRLTEAQKRVIREIDADLAGPHPLNRLVQGDVGSGKTVVALVAALRAVENGYQAALMAPTEVLAEQHHRTLTRLLAPLGMEPALLLGRLSPAEKKAAAERIESGAAQIVVGTHALIQEGVAFHDLGLVIVDEQHRFGVTQRLALKEKGRHTDCLVLTATPIPRSLALTLYGDLDVSVIDELPAGRKPVATHIVPERKRPDMQKFIGERLAAGERAYVVCPRIEETEESERASAEAWFVRYRDEIFPQRKVVMLHGRLAPAEKEAAMREFESGEAQVLVGTTVIEVGIDVAAATVIVIENAERFGLSQLHQLRGRVGRSDRQSWCLLVPSPGVGPESRARLKILEATNDGFRISEEDLRLRGPGDFFGERQSGLPELKAADIVEDYPVLVEARREAEKILREDPHLALPENQQMRKELILRYRSRVGFLRAG